MIIMKTISKYIFDPKDATSITLWKSLLNTFIDIRTLPMLVFGFLSTISLTVLHRPIIS